MRGLGARDVSEEKSSEHRLHNCFGYVNAVCEKRVPRADSCMSTRGVPLLERRIFSIATNEIVSELLLGPHLNGVWAFLACADANEAANFCHPDLSVTDFSCGC